MISFNCFILDSRKKKFVDFSNFLTRKEEFSKTFLVHNDSIVSVEILMKVSVNFKYQKVLEMSM